MVNSGTVKVVVSITAVDLFVLEPTRGMEENVNSTGREAALLFLRIDVIVRAIINFEVPKLGIDGTSLILVNIVKKVNLVTVRNLQNLGEVLKEVKKGTSNTEVVKNQELKDVVTVLERTVLKRNLVVVSVDTQH